MNTSSMSRAISMTHRWCWWRCIEISLVMVWNAFFSRGFSSTSIMLSVYIPCFYLLFHFSNISLLPPRVWHKAAVFVLPSNAFKLLFLWLTCLWFCGTESRHLHLSSMHMCLHVCVSVLLLRQTILFAMFNVQYRRWGVMVSCLQFLVPVHPVQ